MKTDKEQENQDRSEERSEESKKRETVGQKAQNSKLEDGEIKKKEHLSHPLIIRRFLHLATLFNVRLCLSQQKLHPLRYYISCLGSLLCYFTHSTV